MAALLDVVSQYDFSTRSHFANPIFRSSRNTVSFAGGLAALIVQASDATIIDRFSGEKAKGGDMTGIKIHTGDSDSGVRRIRFKLSRVKRIDTRCGVLDRHPPGDRRSRGRRSRPSL